MCATKAITLQPANVTAVRNDEEAFTGLMEKLAKNNGFSVFIGVMTNVLLLSVVWIAFSPILSMAILPSTIIALGMYFIARSKAA